MNEDRSKNKKHLFFYIFPLNTFFEIEIHPFPFEITERIICFSRVVLSFEMQAGYFFISLHTKHEEQSLDQFSENFSNHSFLMNKLFLPDYIHHEFYVFTL